jgi:hypothetical protein
MGKGKGKGGKKGGEVEILAAMVHGMVDGCWVTTTTTMMVCDDGV